MPVGAAVSTDVSASIATNSNKQSSNPPPDHTPRSSMYVNVSPGSPRAPTHARPQPLSKVENISHEGVTTRGMIPSSELIQTVRTPRTILDMILHPRISVGVIAANAPCYILRPNYGDTVVAEDRTGGSWKSPSAKFVSLCNEEHLMVQVHRVIIPYLPLLCVEERQPFKTLDEALVKPFGSSIYMKCDSRLMWKKSSLPKSAKQAAAAKLALP
ncbi:hypothetical protein KC19_VG214800 [Ceratodon purpureus]|uniref:Uncharacterized protein n=1 Tax=Ceratodon purpureus TaxID=3225 RepID=A0A8T0HTN7_CERPU|nr:hypothetical protein KC19_VG214800 [Ceratodon purpureus]